MSLAAAHKITEQSQPERHSCGKIRREAVNAGAVGARDYFRRRAITRAQSRRARVLESHVRSRMRRSRLPDEATAWVERGAKSRSVPPRTNGDAQPAGQRTETWPGSLSPAAMA
jgi:hypothetical protein